ncbi:MAG: alpha-hydroxy-acid oxidizing protein [Desulfovibrionaceae bacterium]|nr:alpha-hydroxy-acid oxidizing protein [Desulfovibrionaceae bacterium]
MNMQEIRKKARERIKSKCRVCPVCDGVACAGEVPGMGGIGTGISFQNNIASLAEHRLIMRTLHEANDPSTELELWGKKLFMPVMTAPVGSVAINLGSDMSDPDYTRHMINGCGALNILGGVGDHMVLDIFRQYMENVSGHGSLAVPFIKPWGALQEITVRMDLAVAAGVDICGMDVDGAGLPTLRQNSVPVRVTSPKALAGIVAEAHKRKMKFIVKGIMSVDEARLVVESGADALVVSNHGGRSLDYCQGAAEVLPDIAQAVGKNILVMVDGGIRSGGDVLKTLALGAKMALICRPVMVAIHGDEENGLPTYLRLIQDQLVQAMRLTGCAAPAAVNRHILA